MQNKIKNKFKSGPHTIYRIGCGGGKKHVQIAEIQGGKHVDALTE